MLHLLQLAGTQRAASTDATALKATCLDARQRRVSVLAVDLLLLSPSQRAGITRAMGLPALHAPEGLVDALQHTSARWQHRSSISSDQQRVDSLAE